MILKRYIQPVLSLLAAGLFSTTSVCAAGAVKSDVKIAVLASQAATPYDETIQGLKQYLQKEGTQADYRVFQLDGDSGKAMNAIEETRSYKPDLILALGSLAANAAADNISDIPIIAGMVLSSDHSVKNKNVSGVFLEYSLETQLEFIRLVLPQAKTIAVIYNVQENQEKIDRAEALGRETGLIIFKQPVHAPREISAALENTAKKADALLAIPDNIVYTPQTVKNILLFSYRNRIPFIGLSSSWVKAGAVYALDWDYTDVGATCGQKALTIVRGEKPDEGNLMPGKRVLYAINQRAAEHMKLEIPEKVLREASQVY
jgi:putative ABC transport system substrate-binding protein